MLRAVAWASVAVLPVVVVGLVVRAGVPGVVGLDTGLVRSATDLTRAHPALLDALLVWQEVSRPRWLYVAASLVCLVVGRRPGLRGRAWWAFGTMMVGWNLAYDLKLLTRRARPLVENAVAQAPGYSFPSGHAANATIIAVTLLILLRPVLRTAAWRVLAATLAVVVVVTAADRVLLGVHYPSDVLAGVLLGVGLPIASWHGWTGWTGGRVPAGPQPEHSDGT